MMHLLALKKYFLDTVGDVDDAEYLALEEKCRFEEHVFNLADESMRDAIIKEAVYTSGREELVKKLHLEKFGAVVQHAKNRYSISSTLTNHVKRGSKHVWELTLSIELDEGIAPVFEKLKIDTRRHKVTRGGVTLDQEKKLSQILCSSTVTIDDKVYPLEADLILEIAYVSTTKCETCELKIINTKRIDGYLVMDCVLSIY